MKFYITEEEDYEGYADGMDTMEINTVDELRAFALGAGGSVKIDYTAHDRDGEAIRCPVIRKPKTRETLVNLSEAARLTCAWETTTQTTEEK